MGGFACGGKLPAARSGRTHAGNQPREVEFPRCERTLGVGGGMSFASAWPPVPAETPALRAFGWKIRETCVSERRPSANA